MLGLTGHGVGDGISGAVLEQSLGGAESAGRLFRQQSGACGDVREQFRVRHDLVDKAEVAGGFSGERFAKEQAFGGARVTHQAREDEAGSGFRTETKIDERELEAGGGSGINEVAVQKHGGANADGDAGDGREDGLGSGGESLQKKDRGTGLTRLGVSKVHEIIAGGKAILRA